MKSESSLLHGNTNIDLPNSVGFFSWNVPENMVYGDEIFAFIYGLPMNDLEAGAPIEKVVANIDDGDRQRVAKALHETIITGRACHQSYAITHPTGRRVVVTAKGRCFRDAEGVPSIYAGTVTAFEARPGTESDDPLESHCIAALNIANTRRHALAARYLSSALNVLRLRQ
ncbi:MAG: PAS domain-containing protein [Neorhizobium sp.]|jgi:hypothetical protein|nr:PAS domain-containing protein [Neorhizobium sp.]